MIHYPHYIGDFDRATRHLSRMERSVYRDLMDLYYDTEARLTLDRKALCRKIVARSKSEISAVAQVLGEFFVETITGWYHDRCEEEIAAYQGNTSAKSLAGRASAEAKRKRKLDALATGAERESHDVPKEPEPVGNEDSTERQQSGNEDSTEPQRNSTNQNQNQNQNQTHTALPPAAIDQPAVGAEVSVCVLVCKAMQETGVKDVNPSDAALAVLVGKGAEVAMFADAALVALAQVPPKGFAYALGVVKNKLTTAAALADAPMAAPVARPGKVDVSRMTVPASVNADAELRRIAADAAIPRKGMPPELRERVALRRQGASAQA